MFSEQMSNQVSATWALLGEQRGGFEKLVLHLLHSGETFDPVTLA